MVLLTVILPGHRRKIFIPEAVLRLPVSEPQVAVPVDDQICVVVLVVRFPRYVTCNVRRRISIIHHNIDLYIIKLDDMTC